MMIVRLQHYGPGAPINDLDLNGCTPLMYAALADSILAIEMLLNFSARRETVSAGLTLCTYVPYVMCYLLLIFIYRLIMREEQLYIMRLSLGSKEL